MIPGEEELFVGRGAVAVQRWFAGGEGWACHPWYDRHGLRLVEALDATLKSARLGIVEVPALGGYLLGEIVADAECPDPKAQGRNPVVVQVAFFPHRVSPDQHKAVLDALHHLPLPMAPGDDERLAISVAINEVPIPWQSTWSIERRSPGPEPSPQRRRWRKRVLAVVALLVLARILLIVLARILLIIARFIATSVQTVVALLVVTLSYVKWPRRWRLRRPDEPSGERHCGD